MYEDNQELTKLEEDIAKVKSMIAQRQSRFEEVPQPKTRVGWASYIANNDRGMLDKYQDAERQWYNLKEQERHAKELADAQRVQQELTNMDENMKNYSIANANYQYAVAAKEADTSKDPATTAMLEQKEAEAKAMLDYWKKRLGEVDKEPEGPEGPELESEDDLKKVTKVTEVTGVTGGEHKVPAVTTEAVDMADMDEYISGKKKFATIKEQQEYIKKAMASPSYNVKGDYYSKVNALERLKSKEAVAADISKWLKEYNALSPSGQRDWKKDNSNKYEALKKAKLVK